MADEKKIIENQIASLKMWMGKAVDQTTAASFQKQIEALEAKMEAPPKKKKKGDKK